MVLIQNYSFKEFLLKCFAYIKVVLRPTTDTLLEGLKT
jgi:hypothetical protein